jgi:hypothetical protein
MKILCMAHARISGPNIELIYNAFFGQNPRFIIAIAITIAAFAPFQERNREKLSLIRFFNFPKLVHTGLDVRVKFGILDVWSRDLGAGFSRKREGSIPYSTHITS